MSELPADVARRRTFAIISHPDAGKTTLTEKLLLFGGAIQMAGTVKGRKAARHATSDWMRLEQQRGISVTSSVMQFPYRGRVVNLLDACDPETFNAALGPGTCVRNGGVRFENFLELLSRHHSVGAWHFTPPQAQMGVGDVLMAVNHGGETHTFTEVEEFGGGIVPLLNTLAGVPDEAPECKALEADDHVAPGGIYTEAIEDAGHEKYQCCIHPWMRLEADIKPAVHTN